MLEYLNFFLLCTLFTLIFYLYIQTKRYINLLKMAEENLIFSSYESPQSDTKRQKLLECILTRNSKLYLGNAGINFIHNHSPRHKPPGHDLKGTKTLPLGQSFCTKTLPLGQNRQSKPPPPGHKVRKFHNVSINSDTI